MMTVTWIYMTDELFRRDGYESEFEAKVVSVDGDLVVLDRKSVV